MCDSILECYETPWHKDILGVLPLPWVIFCHGSIKSLTKGDVLLKSNKIGTQ